MPARDRARPLPVSGWSGLEVRHLAAFAAVAERRSFARAARDLGYTSPAISQQLAQLEQIVGERLVSRASGSSLVELTDSGRLFLQHAQRVLAQVDAARADVAARNGTLAGVVRVAAAPTVAHRLLPAIFRRFSGSRAGEKRGMFVIEASTPEEMATALESGEADLAVTGVPLPGGPFDIRTLMLDPYVLAVSAEHELAGRARIPADVLDTLQLGALKHTSPEFDEYVGTYAATRRVGFRSDDYPHLLGMVDAGITCALVSRLVVEPRAPGVKLVELDPPPPPRRIVLARHAGRVPTESMEAFVQAAEQAGRELGGERAIRVA